MKLDVSGVYAFFTADASNSTFKGEGSYAIASFAYPFGPTQLTLFGKVANKDRSWDATTSTWNLGNSSSFGGRIRTSAQACLGLFESLPPNAGHSDEQSAHDLSGYFKVLRSQSRKFLAASRRWGRERSRRLPHNLWLELLI